MQSLHKCKITLLTLVQISVDNDSYLEKSLVKNLDIYVAADLRKTHTRLVIYVLLTELHTSSSLIFCNHPPLASAMYRPEFFAKCDYDAISFDIFIYQYFLYAIKTPVLVVYVSVLKTDCVGRSVILLDWFPFILYVEKLSYFLYKICLGFLCI
ncbi:unnamed protein product [Spodoptera littoralis]|uniref:Uncharacterized protein n=1 Tax=Spodoptera littoralis TaxID=7109 RepID=A0A9P0I4X8_SPOLI|nr:unnamed protein product [Spodoptera littoralis]CAH1639499.1 unnamed protein product [Spodoptera littoralis]